MGCRMEKFLPVVNRKDCCKVWLDDVVYIENEGRRLKIVTDEKEFYIYAKLSDLEKYFSGEPCFFSAMKRLVVHFDHVSSMKNQVICFSNGTEYPLGRVNYLKTKQTFVNYMHASPEMSRLTKELPKAESKKTC